MITGYDILNAMRRAHGLSTQPVAEHKEAPDPVDALTRMQRLIMVLMFAIKGVV